MLRQIKLGMIILLILILAACNQDSINTQGSDLSSNKINEIPLNEDARADRDLLMKLGIKAFVEEKNYQLDLFQNERIELGQHVIIKSQAFVTHTDFHEQWLYLEFENTGQRPMTLSYSIESVNNIEGLRHVQYQIELAAGQKTIEKTYPEGFTGKCFAELIDKHGIKEVGLNYSLQDGQEILASDQSVLLTFNWKD